MLKQANAFREIRKMAIRHRGLKEVATKMSAN
jgi:hypothetical protein